MNMPEEEKHRDFNQLVSKYLSGEILPDELSYFREELLKDPAKQELLDEYRLIWDSSVPGQSYNLDEEWTQLQQKLPGFRAESDTGKAGRGIVRSLGTYYYRIAAVLVLGVIFTFSLIYLSRMTGMIKVVAEEAPVEVRLEDGTGVIVNRNSTLRYRKKYDQEERKVYLSGEAWFDVARDSSIPFVIDAGEALVEVLGTSFNVSAYKDYPTVEITVESGLVAMSPKENQKDQIVMKAGSGGSYDKSQKELKLIPTSDPNSISWKTREFIFDTSTLLEVSSQLNKVYGANIVIMNPELADCTITVSFKEQTLDAILKVLEITLDLQISRYGDEIRLDGEGCAD